METMTKGKNNMGKVITKIKIENSIDLGLTKLGLKPEKDVRKIDIDALVDTGAGLLCLNPSLIEKLGLSFLKEIKVDTAHGVSTVKVYRDAILTIMDRSCPIDVVEINSRNQALVGYLALEALDLVVDPKAQKVTTNPEHQGEMIMDLI